MLLSSLLLLSFLFPTTVSSHRAAGDTRPNIILYIPDTIRAESLSAYGHPFISTPNTDRLSKRSVLFDQAHVQHTQCSPSREAILSGRYLHVLGHRTQTHLLQNKEPNVFRYLKESGYATVMVGKNDMLSADSFNSSFSYWDQVLGVGDGGSPYSYGDPGYYSFLSSASSHNGSDPAHNQDLSAVQTVSQWLQMDPPEPFAIWVSGIGAHPPYGAPKDYFDLYTPAQIKEKAPLRPYSASANKPAFIGPGGIPGFRDLNSFDDSFFEKIASIYLGRVAYMDFVLGQLLDGLDAAPSSIANNTAFIFTSDHGDFSGDWHNVEKYPCALDDVLTRVPLLISYPQGGLSNVRVPGPVESLDLFATLLDMAGILGNETTGIERHFAQTLLPFITGDASAVPRKWVFSEAGYAPGTFEMEPLDPAQASQYADKKNLYYPRGTEEMTTGHCTHAVMVRNATVKMVYRRAPGASELYDLTSDPQELQNQFGNARYAAAQAEMTADLLDWLVDTSDITPLIEDDRGPPPKPVTPPFPWPTG